jgi:hypothetical protein
MGHHRRRLGAYLHVPSYQVEAAAKVIGGQELYVLVFRVKRRIAIHNRSS